MIPTVYPGAEVSPEEVGVLDAKGGPVTLKWENGVSFLAVDGCFLDDNGDALEHWRIVSAVLSGEDVTVGYSTPKLNVVGDINLARQDLIAIADHSKMHPGDLIEYSAHYRFDRNLIVGRYWSDPPLAVIWHARKSPLNPLTLEYTIAQLASRGIRYFAYTGDKSISPISSVGTAQNKVQSRGMAYAKKAAEIHTLGGISKPVNALAGSMKAADVAGGMDVAKFNALRRAESL